MADEFDDDRDWEVISGSQKKVSVEEEGREWEVISGNQEQIQSINGELMYVNKKRNVYGFGLGVDKDFFPIISGRLYWKIGK